MEEIEYGDDGSRTFTSGVTYSGAALRDQFAMAALSGLMSRTDSANRGVTSENAAAIAYRAADAMIAARMPDLSGLNEDALAMLAARGGK